MQELNTQLAFWEDEELSPKVDKGRNKCTVIRSLLGVGSRALADTETYTCLNRLNV